MSSHQLGLSISHLREPLHETESHPCVRLSHRFTLHHQIPVKAGSKDRISNAAIDQELGQATVGLICSVEFDRLY